jgi:hypothetical protein
MKLLPPGGDTGHCASGLLYSQSMRLCFSPCFCAPSGDALCEAAADDRQGGSRTAPTRLPANRPALAVWRRELRFL